MKARTEGEVAAKPPGDLSPFSPSARISFKAITGVFVSDFVFLI